MLISSENTRRKKCNFRRLFYSVTRDKPFVLWYIPASRFRALAQPAEKPSPRRCSSQPSTSWKDGRVVDCTALERRHTEIPYRGFESLSFRQDFLYRRRFKAAVRRGHKLGHQKPKMPPIWIVLVRGFLSIRNLQMCASLWQPRAAFRSQRQPMRAGFGQKS